MKTIILLLLNVCLTTLLNAQISKTVNLSTQGELSTTLTPNELATITDLSITGLVDARDFKTMRDSMPILTIVNLTGASITSYTGANGPDWNTTNYETNLIPARSFINKSTITTIAFPQATTEIGEFAFSGCNKLTQVYLNSSLTTIGDFVFNSCEKMTQITLPTSITSIGSDVFADCTRLTTITIPPLVTNLKGNLFENNYGLQTVSLSEGLTSIGGYLFFECNSISTITIPSTVTFIGSSAFWECYGLSTVYCLATNPANISISSNAFEHAEISNSILYVPANTKALYEVADVWKDFGTIVEIISTTNPIPSKFEPLNVYLNANSQILNVDAGNAQTRLTITNLSGRNVLTKIVSGQSSLNIGYLNNGLYLVTVNGKTTRFMKK